MIDNVIYLELNHIKIKRTKNVKTMLYTLRAL